jgi:putative ABC transport system permease protein
MSLRRGRDATLYRFATGEPAAVWEKVREGAVVVSEPFAYRHGIPPQDGRLALQTDQGAHTFEIAGICYDYSTEEGIVLMSREVYDRFFADRGVSSVGAYVAEGYALDDVVAGVRAALRDKALRVAPNQGLRARALEVFDRTFAVTNALRLLAVVVAFIGVWSALMALQVERTRELATLQALGLTSDRLWSLTLLESGLMGGAAGLLSLPTGALLAVILIEVINVRSFGWTMRLQLDPWLFAQAVAVSVLASLLAAVYPLLRLQRMPVSAALRQE